MGWHGNSTKWWDDSRCSDHSAIGRYPKPGRSSIPPRLFLTIETLNRIQVTAKESPSCPACIGRVGLFSGFCGLVFRKMRVTNWLGSHVFRHHVSKRSILAFDNISLSKLLSTNLKATGK